MILKLILTGKSDAEIKMYAAMNGILRQSKTSQRENDAFFHCHRLTAANRNIFPKLQFYRKFQ